MSGRLKLIAIAIAAFALPSAANAADKPPSKPPTSSSGGGTGSSGGNPAPIPEPEQMLLFGVAFAGLVAARRLHRTRA